MRCMLAVVISICVLFASGCRMSAEIDDYSYAMMIGIDRAQGEAGEYVFTYRIILPQAFAGDGKAKDDEKARIVSVKASSLSESYKLVGLAMNRQLNATHIVGFVFSEDVAKEGIYDIVSSMNKSVLFRNSVVLVVSKDSAKTFIEKNKAPFEVFPSRWTESLRDDQTRSGAYFVSDAREFYRQSREPLRAGVLTYAGVAKDGLAAKGSPVTETSEERGYTVETFPREGGSEAVAVGSAVFVDWKMVGTLTSAESFGGVLLKEVLRVPLDIVDPRGTGQVYSFGVRTTLPEIDVRIENGRMVADITVDGVAELMELRCEADEQSGDVYTLLEEELGRAVTASVHAYLAKTKSWGADCIGLANHYRKETSSLTEWSEHDWQSLYRNADIRVHANIIIKRRGYHPDEMHGGDAFAM